MITPSHHIPDFTDPRYLNEIGWFINHEKDVYSGSGMSYTDARIANSHMQLQEFFEISGKDEAWMVNQTVVTIGPGCTGDLSAWPAGRKISVDPLLIVYQRLGMLIGDVAGAEAVWVVAAAESLPLIDACADLVYCRNALDHIMNPVSAVSEISRILKPDGLFYVDVDLGGIPTPDEPMVFTSVTLQELIAPHFRTRSQRDRSIPHSKNSHTRRELLLEHYPGCELPRMEKAALLSQYLQQF